LKSTLFEARCQFTRLQRSAQHFDIVTKVEKRLCISSFIISLKIGVRFFLQGPVFSAVKNQKSESDITECYEELKPYLRQFQLCPSHFYGSAPHKILKIGAVCRSACHTASVVGVTSVIPGASSFFTRRQHCNVRVPCVEAIAEQLRGYCTNYSSTHTWSCCWNRPLYRKART
jgi:hypothetical protein